MSEIRNEAVPYKVWGQAFIEKGALAQMDRAARLPVSVQGALMPDAHEGYGLPIGGVLATRDAVIPYAVGVDIACRVRITIFNASPHVIGQKRDKFRKILEENTRFGAGGEFRDPADHPVLQDPAFQEIQMLHSLKNTAWRQLGTSGSGNHFVDIGAITIHDSFEGQLAQEAEGYGSYGKVPPGKYLAILSHSGSRGLGYNIANHFTQLAISLHPELSKDYRHLAWLDMQSHFGQEYWRAMNLAGRYASANHAIIHHKIADAMRFEILGGVENHHNFAWRETHNGEELYVHRKGATPAGEGVHGIIPGTMLTPGYLVVGRGETESLDSAAHGAGRQMSRSQAFNHFEWDKVERQLKNAGVELLSGGLDESPGAYKDIHAVMQAQSDLVKVLGEFQPLLVKMDADKGSRRRRQERNTSPDRKRYKETLKDKRKND